MTARTAEVAVFAGVRGPARTFTYSVPDGLDARRRDTSFASASGRAPSPALSCGSTRRTRGRCARSTRSSIRCRCCARISSRSRHGSRASTAAASRTRSARCCRPRSPVALAPGCQRRAAIARARVRADARGARGAVGAPLRLGARQLATLRALARGRGELRGDRGGRRRGGRRARARETRPGARGRAQRPPHPARVRARRGRRGA